MGKIRVKTFDESQEERDKKLKAKREAKKQAHVSGMKGGERTVMVGVSAEDLEKATSQPTESAGQPSSIPPSGTTAGKTKKAKFAKRKVKSKRYTANVTLVNKKTSYPLPEAIEKLKGFQQGKFDETVELHINVKEKGISGQIILPHGTGKKVRVTVAENNNVDDIVKQIEGGKIDFDVLVATPAVMPKLARVARVLGPRGLMPNPKNGTITNNPQDTVEKFTKGQISYKTESGAPIIHLSMGKVSFEGEKLRDNVKTVLSSVGASKINSAVLKSTMSPAIKLDTSSF